MSRQSTSSGKLRVLSRSETNGRRSTRYVDVPTFAHPMLDVSACTIISVFPGYALNRSITQESQEKYRESKKELDELVATMEGL